MNFFDFKIAAETACELDPDVAESTIINDDSVTFILNPDSDVYVEISENRIRFENHSTGYIGWRYFK